MTFSIAKQNMLKYLDSDNFKKREDADDTISSIPLLKKIISFDLITFNSQEGTIKNGYNEQSKKYYIIEERAYVIGFMKTNKAYEFINMINSKTDKIAFIISINTSKKFSKRFMDGTLKVPNITVTTSGSSKRKNDIKLKPFTNIYTVLPKSILDQDKKTVGVNKINDIECVVCIDTKYGRSARSTDGLYTDIIKCIKS